MKSSLYDSLESLVSNEVIFVPLAEEIPLERGHQRGVPPPLRNRYFTTISSSSVKTVADRQGRSQEFDLGGYKWVKETKQPHKNI